MSAKGILKKIREIYVKLAARKLVGNFRYRKFWSDKASAFMRDRELFSFVENTDDSLGSAFVRDVREYYNYYGEYDLQAINLALSLLRDIYSPEVLPVELCEEVFGRKRTAELIGEELFELLCKFGGMDIVYHDDKHKVPKWIKNCCHLNRKLYDQPEYPHLDGPDRKAFLLQVLLQDAVLRFLQKVQLHTLLRHILQSVFQLRLC